MGQAIPAALTATGVAIPSATAALVVLHAMIPGSNSQCALPAVPSGKSVAAVVPSVPQPAAAASPTNVTTRTIAGPVVDDRYGQVHATITVTARKITNVSIAAPENDPGSAAINQQAVPMWRSETLQAQNANVDVISGATITSDAYTQSL